MTWLGVIKAYQEFLPVSKHTPIISLKEGNTPLIRSSCLEKELNADLQIYFKYEGLNPTGSFKDRGMTVAISKAKEEGSGAVICASTGNTSASAAAYAAKAGMDCIVLIPKGAIALGKLSQALIHGARVIAVDGNFDACLNLVRQISQNYPVTLVNSLNPYRIEGQKTASFEICDCLGRAPDYQAMPVGNAGNITAYWKGYKEYKENKKIRHLPRMLGFQAEGAAPIVRGKIIENPQTLATAIRIGNPASWQEALHARDESGGLIDMVSDTQIIEAYKILAEKEGIFVEPASAASVAGLIKLVKSGYFSRHSGIPSSAEAESRQRREKAGKRKTRTEKRKTKIVVCILTGHGLKDPDRAIKTIEQPKIVKADLKAVLKEIGY